MTFYSPRSRLLKPLSLEESTILKDKAVKLVTKIITCPESTTQKMVDIYRWRTETQFPIAKIKSVRVVPCEDTTKDDPQTQSLEVVFQQLSLTFADFADIPLFRILYLFKETLIGVERLYSKFGSFDFTESMIFVNEAGKCKVWVNEIVEINDYKTSDLKEVDFLARIFQMFKSRTADSKQSQKFYEKMKQSNSFFSALECLESYVDKQKIKVLTFFRMQPSSSGTTSLEKKKKKIDLNLTMSKKPNFLTSLEFNSNKDESPVNKKDLYSSTKFIPSRAFFSRPEMKISGDTAAESEKYIKSSNEYGSPESPPSMGYSRTLLKEKEKDLWNSGKYEREQRLTAIRKFSNSIRSYGQSSPTISIQAPKSFPPPLQENQISSFFSQSMTFCDVLEKSSRSSSTDNKEKLIVKKTEVFNVNGWQTNVNSLFSNNESEYKKSFCEHHRKHEIKTENVKLDLLDKCVTNMHESFIEDGHGH